MQRMLLALMLAASLCGSAGADAPVDWGPLTVRSMAPVFTNRLSYTPGRILPLDDGMTELQLLLTHVNDWAQMPGYFFDGEWTRLAMRAGYGLAKGFELQAEVPLYGRSGGFLDNFIMGFHQLFGVTQARRGLYPRNQLRVVTYDARGTHVWLTHRDAGVGFGNPTIGVKKRLTPANVWPVFAAELTVKLPLGSIAAQYATPNFAALLSVGLHMPLPLGFGVFAATGLIFSPGDQVVYGMPLVLFQKFLLAGVEWRVSAAFSIVAHYLNQDGIAEQCIDRPLDKTTHEFALGIKWAPGGSSRWLLEAGLLENSVHDANTPDFGLHTAVRWRF